MIDINNITVQIDTKILLKEASAHISDGQNVGLIGDNGCGKSTLFRVLRGELETVAGNVFFPSGYKISFVEQTIQNTDMAILDFVLSKDKDLISARERLKTVPDWEQSAVLDELKILGSDSAEGRVARILSGLGFSNEDLSRPVSSFSGGWRMRLALAGALFQPSDVLLLDEPTNHLDLETTLWLENHLKKYKGTLILISHDRNILNSICNYIIHFENKKLISYGGNYDTFQKTRAIQQQVLTRQAHKMAAKRAHLQSFVDRFRYKASKAKQAQSRIKMLEKMGEMPEVFLDNPDSFSFPEAENLLPPLISIEAGSTGYGEHVVLRNLSFSIGPNDRIALLGKNGNGKTTLAKLICGNLSLFDGNMHRSNKLQIGYFAQHQEDDLPLEETPVSFLQSLMPEETQTKVRSHLAQFGLEQEKALTPIKLLSGGEKARLLFARMSLLKPGLLILDEPTNHLDIRGRDALVDALNSYNGAVILITHDFHLIESAAEDLWLINEGRCLPFTGDLNDYQEMLLQKEEKQDKSKNKPREEQDLSPQAQMRKNAAQVRQIRAKLLQKERELDTLSTEKERLQNRFQEPLQGSEIQEIQKKLLALEAQISQVEEEWMILSEDIA